MIRRIPPLLGILLFTAVALAASSAKVLRFHKYSLMDPQGIGGEAASMLVPTDTGRWTAVWSGGHIPPYRRSASCEPLHRMG